MIIEAVYFHWFRNTIVVLLGDAIFVGKRGSFCYLTGFCESVAICGNDRIPVQSSGTLVVVHGYLVSFEVISIIATAASIEVTTQSGSCVLLIHDLRVEQLIDSPQVLITAATIRKQHTPIVASAGCQIKPR